MMDSILTIGHSTHEFDLFSELLSAYEVTTIADVRSKPYSRLCSQFNREALKAQLQKKQISYVFLGKELGARPEDPNCYIKGRVRYRKLAETELFKEGLQRVVAGSKSARIALLCAEREPLLCHRGLLIARELETLGVPVSHILADGRIEPHAQTVVRLLDLWKMYGDDLFRTREETVEDAYARQEQRVAYLDEDMQEEAFA
jgi:uncharacterized protein (DUF488 family)